MITWIKKLLTAVRDFDRLQVEHDKLDRKVFVLENQLSSARSEVKALYGIVQQHTSLSVDVGFHRHCNVILLGRWRSNDYVQSFNVTAEDFGHLVEQLKEMQKYHKITRLDAPPQIRSTILRELDL